MKFRSVVAGCDTSLVPGARVLVCARTPGKPLQVQVGSDGAPTLSIPVELAGRVFVQAPA